MTRLTLSHVKLLLNSRLLIRLALLAMPLALLFGIAAVSGECATTASGYIACD